MRANPTTNNYFPVSLQSSFPSTSLVKDASGWVMKTPMVHRLADLLADGWHSRLAEQGRGACMARVGTGVKEAALCASVDAVVLLSPLGGEPK